MNTSYYSKYKGENAVSIARMCPKWFKGRDYKNLAPSYELFMKCKEDGDEDYFARAYKNEVLDKLNAKDIYEDLGSNAVLLCWEGPNKFCHRHLVAEWFKNELGIVITEL